MTANNSVSTVIVGEGSFQYQADDQWLKLPEGWMIQEVIGVAVDSQDKVYLFNRGDHPVIVCDPDGNVVSSWGAGKFVRPHGIWIGPDDSMYLTDDEDHTIRKYSTDGELLMTLGESGVASDTGVEGIDYRTIKRPGGPFNLPTNVALSSDGTMFITDGYGNAQVHKFSADGQLISSWGEPGSEPGQFNCPHGIGIDQNDRVFVADRENSRLQVFTSDGEFLEEWTDVLRPCEVFFDDIGNVYVAELGSRSGMFDWMTPDTSQPGGRLSIFNLAGNLLARIGGGENPTATGDFFAPHDVWVDSTGAVYVAEVVWSAGGKIGMVPADCPSLQKFTPVR